jgi:hypothetical protein
MDRLIRTTTEHFLAMLGDQREFFSPEELVEAGLPEFLVKRMQLELVRNLQDSVTPPKSDWADMSTEAVREAWNRFLEAIHDEIRLPASYAASVIESSMADILDLMVTPRAFLPEYIFGSEKQLDLQSIRERCEWVVIYTYFATALPRFMEKKGRSALTKEQADRIIERLDERVTSHYTSLNWAQLFEPWFQLLGEKVEPGLFASFFRDKGKPGVARLFDSETEPLNRTRLIEILSKPQLDDIDEEFEDVGGDLLEDSAPLGVIDLTYAVDKDIDQSADEEAAPEEEPAVSAKKKPEPEPEEAVKPKQKPTPEPESEPETESMELEKPKPEPQSQKKSEKQKVEESDPEGPEEQPVDREPKTETGRESKSEQKPGKKQKQGSEPARDEAAGKSDNEDDANLIAHYQKTNGNDKHDPPLVSVLRNEPEGEEDEDSIPLYSKLKPVSEDEDVEAVPIWQKFTKEEDETGSDGDGDPAAVEKDEGVVAPGAASEEDIEKVRSYVKDMEEEFVAELFGGDEDAFLEAIEHITRLDSWKEAGSYISREVFDRNLIDIYSDTAIYFTDRMQTYFLERE